MVRQVQTVEAGHKDSAVTEPQLLDDVVADPRGRGGGQGDHRRVRQDTSQRLQITVVGAEVVAPLGDAVGLVHGYEAHVKTVEKGPEPIERKPLGRDVEDLEPSSQRVGLDPASLGRWQ